MPARGTRAVGGYLLAVVALAAVYYGAAKLGLRLAYLDGAVTALWPPVGVGIAALTLFGLRLWPGIVVGDLLAADYSTPLGTVLGQTTGNTLEVLVAALLLRRLVGAGVGLTRVVQVLALVACAAVGTLISACFGIGFAAAGERHHGGRVRRGVADVVAVGLLGRARGDARDPQLGEPGSVPAGPAAGARGRCVVDGPGARRRAAVAARCALHRLPAADLGGAAVRAAGRLPVAAAGRRG